MSALQAKLERELNMTSRRGLQRVLRPPQGLDFCSNDYLGLAKDRRIIQAVKNAADLYGYGSTSSRFIRGQREIYDQVERDFSCFKSTEKSLLFQSGYAANLGALSALIKPKDLVICDKLNHASIVDALLLTKAKIIIFNHLDVDELNKIASTAEYDGHKFLITESLYSMDGDIAPLAKYAQICRENNIYLIVDEAHALGLYGQNGSGLIEHFGVQEQVLLSINGLGKAFGCLGAFISGSNIVVEYVLQKARTLMYSTALPPLCVAAIAKSLEIIKDGGKLRNKLFNNIDYLQKLLHNKNIKINTNNSPIFPLIIKDSNKAQNIAQILLDNGYDIRAIRPPTVPINSARLRLTTNISHTFEILENFVECLASTL